MSNCKAFGHLRARNHAIGQTPRNVLEPHSPKEFQGSAAFDKRKDDAGETPERRRHNGCSPPAPARRRRTRINDVEPELGVSDQRVCADRNTVISARTNSSIADRSTAIRKLPGSTAIVSRAMTQAHRAMTSERRIWNRHLPERGPLTDAGLIALRPTPTAWHHTSTPTTRRTPAPSGECPSASIARRSPTAATGAISVTHRSRLV